MTLKEFLRQLADRSAKLVRDPLPEAFYAAPMASLAACFQDAFTGGTPNPEVEDEYHRASVASIVGYTLVLRPLVPTTESPFKCSLSDVLDPQQRIDTLRALTVPFNEARTLGDLLRLSRYSRYRRRPYDEDETPAERQKRDKEDDKIEDELREAIGPHAYYEYLLMDRTPFYPHQQEIFAIFNQQIPYSIPRSARRSHQVIVGTTDHGKTVCLETMILADLAKPDPPGMVVIDSKGDLVKSLSRLEVFNPRSGRLRGRLIYIDPRDAPALALFDVGTASGASNQVSDQLSYFLGSLLQEDVSGPMGGVLKPLAQLLMNRKGANLTTLLDAIDDIEPFGEEIAKLPETAQRFFLRDYNVIAKETKTALKRRIYNIALTSPEFERSFNAHRNALDLRAALDNGQIVLISTEVRVLGELSAVFGRYFIFRTMAAAYNRLNRDRDAFLYVDEAAPYVDQKIEELYTTLRSYGLGAVFAFQDFSQVKTYQRVVMGSSAIKMVGGNSLENAKTFASEMGSTTPEFINAQGRDPGDNPRFTRFALHVRNTGMTQAVGVTIPVGALEQEPKMPQADYEQFLQTNRAALADIVPSPPPETISVTDPIHEPEPIAAPPAPSEPPAKATPSRSEPRRRRPRGDIDIRPVKE